MRLQTFLSFTLVSAVALASALPVVQVSSDTLMARKEQSEMARSIQLEDVAMRGDMHRLADWKREISGAPTADWKRDVSGAPTADWKRDPEPQPGMRTADWRREPQSNDDSGASHFESKRMDQRIPSW